MKLGELHLACFGATPKHDRLGRVKDHQYLGTQDAEDIGGGLYEWDMYVNFGTRAGVWKPGLLIKCARLSQVSYASLARQLDTCVCQDYQNVMLVLNNLVLDDWWRICTRTPRTD